MLAATIVYFGLLGTAVGSFLNVVADRLPEGGSVVSPRSHCTSCGRQLSAWELIPVASYLALQGRCRTCEAPIGIRSPAVELTTGLLFGLAAWRIRPGGLASWMTLVLTSTYLAVLVVCTVTDLERGLILDRVTIPAIGLGLLGALLTGWPGVLFHLGGGLVGAGTIALIITLVPGGMGWGDAKLAGFIGLVTGLPGALSAMFLGFVCGGLVAAVLLVTGRAGRGDTVPLGPFLALGGAAVLLYGEKMVHVFHTWSMLLG